MEGEKSQIISFAEFDLFPRRRQLLRGKDVVSLNAKAFDLVCFLAQNAGRVISKDEILNSVWKDQFIEESNLAVQISALRKALGEQASKPRFLVTIPGKGYQFIADVSVSEEPTASESRSVELEKESEEVADVGDAKNKRPVAVFSPYRNLIFTLSGAVLLILAALAAFNFYSDSPTKPAITSLAVLPFANQTGEPASGYLCDGLAESVIFSLSRVPNLRIMSRDSAFRYRETQGDVKDIGRELGVQAVLTGRVSQVGDSLSVSTELISTNDNSVIWAGQFVRKMSDIERLQADIAQVITRELQIKLAGAEARFLKKSQTENAEAFQFYLTGRYHLNKFTDDGFFKARDSFQKAVDKDPDYALAYAGLAESYNLLSGWGAIAPNDGYPFAKAAALRALELDDDLAEAHTSLGIAKLFYDLDWAGAEMEFTRAVEINPSYSTAHHNQSLVFTMQGRFDEAKLSIARAREHDPLSILNIIMTGNIFYFQRQPSQAIDLYKEAVEMDPNSGLARWSLGNAYLSSNRTDEAIAEYQKAIPLSGGSLDEPASLGYALAISGNTNGARQVINDLKNRSKEKYIPQTLIAMIYGGLGDKEQAFESLNRAFIERDSGLLFLKVDPMFDPLRSDQRFVDILKRVNLAQ